MANKSLQATPINSIASRQRDGVAACPVLRGSAIAEDVINPACLSSGR